MRNIGLDLGARHIAYCEVRDGEVVDRTSVQRLEQLKSRLGPGTAPARVAFEASREGWYVHDTLVSWGHEAKMIDTTHGRWALGITSARTTHWTPRWRLAPWTKDESPRRTCFRRSDESCGHN